MEKKIMQKFRFLSFRQQGFNGAVYREIRLWLVLQNYLPGCSVKKNKQGDKRLVETEKFGKICQAIEDEGSEYRTARVEIQTICLRWNNKNFSDLLDMGIKEEKETGNDCSSQFVRQKCH